MSTAVQAETATQSAEFTAKVERFRALLERERNERIARVHTILHTNAIAEGRRGYEEIEIEGGQRRFVKVISNNGTQRTIIYFVEVATGKIYGHRSWKAYNPARLFGTLDTMDEWYWGEYYGVHKNGKGTLVPKAERV